MKGKLLFKEEQSFVGTKIFNLVVGIILLVIGGSLTQFFMNPSAEGSIITLSITLLVMGAIIWLFIVARLEISIDNQCIYYRYFPFIQKEKAINKNQLKDIYVRKYRPLSDYGGWGYRGTGKNRALNVSGNFGLQMLLVNKEKILVGTQNPTELEYVVKQLKKKWELNG